MSFSYMKRVANTEVTVKSIGVSFNTLPPYAPSLFAILLAR